MYVLVLIEALAGVSLGRVGFGWPIDGPRVLLSVLFRLLILCRSIREFLILEVVV